MSYKWKKILTIILFLLFGSFIFSKSLNIFIFNDGLDKIKKHQDKIEGTFQKQKNYVTKRIDESRKLFDDLDDGMDQYKYDSQTHKDKRAWEVKRMGDSDYQDARDKYLNLFAKHKQRLEDIKAKLRAEGIIETDFILDKRYKEEVIYAFEQIAFMFNGDAAEYFTDCDYFDGSSYQPKCNMYKGRKSKRYYSYGTAQENIDYLENLKKQLGEVYLISNERERGNKITVLHEKISSIYFTEVEKDEYIRWASYAAENAAKALLPYRDFIFEILNAQRKINQKEAEGYLKKFVYARCVYKMKTKFNDTDKEAYEYCNKVTRKESVHYSIYRPHKYYLLDSYTSGKTLIKFLQSYKDFGVTDDE